MAEWVSAVAAIVAAAFACAAWLVARRASDDSRRSADASEVSAAAAADTAAVARTEAARRVEPSDVAWEFVGQPDDQRSRIEYRNIGLSAAHNVQAALMLDGVRVDLSPGSIEPAGRFSYDAREQYELAERRWREGLDSGFIGTPGIAVEARILWTSQLGTPATWIGTNHA